MKKGTGYGATAKTMAGARMCTRHLDYSCIDTPPSPERGAGIGAEEGIVATYLPPGSPAPADIPDLATGAAIDSAAMLADAPADAEPPHLGGGATGDDARPEPWEDGAMWKTRNAKERSSWIKDTLLDGAELSPQTNVAGTSDPFREFLRGAARFYIARASPTATWAEGRLRAFGCYSQRFQHKVIGDLDRFQGRSAVRHYKNYCFFYKYVSRGVGFAYDAGMRSYFVGQEAMSVHHKRPKRGTRSDGTDVVQQPYIVWYFDHSWVDLPAAHTAVLRELLGVADAKVNAAPLGQWSVLDAVATAVAVDIPDMCGRVVDALTNDTELQCRLATAAGGVEPSGLLSQWRELRTAANMLRLNCDQPVPAHMTLGTGTEHIVAALALVWRVDIVLLRREDEPWVAGIRCGLPYTGPWQAGVEVRTPVVLYQPAQSGDPWRTVSCIDPMHGEATIDKPGAKVMQPMPHGKDAGCTKEVEEIDKILERLMIDTKESVLADKYMAIQSRDMEADEMRVLTPAEIAKIRNKLYTTDPKIQDMLDKNELKLRIVKMHKKILKTIEKMRDTEEREEAAERAEGMPVCSGVDANATTGMTLAGREEPAYARLAAKFTGLLLQALSYDATKMLSSGELKNIEWIMAMDTASKTLMGAVGYSESEVKVLAVLRNKEGTGGVLLTHAMWQMRGDTTKLTVESVDSAVAFYQKMGFIECEKKKSPGGGTITMQREASEVQLRQKEGVTLIKYEKSEWGDDVILGCVNDVASSEKMLELYGEVVDEREMNRLEEAVQKRDSVAVDLDREFQLPNGTFPGIGARLVMYENNDGEKVAAALEVQLKTMEKEKTIVEVTAGRVYRENPKDAEIVLSTMIHYLIATVMDYDDGTDGQGGVREYDKIVEILSGRVWYGLTKDDAGSLKWVGRTHRERFNKYADADARALVRVRGETAGRTSKLELQNMEWGHLEEPVSYSFGNMVVTWFENNSGDMAVHPEDSSDEERNVNSPSLSDYDEPMDIDSEAEAEAEAGAEPGDEDEAAGDPEQEEEEASVAMVCEDGEITRKIAAAREKHKRLEEQKQKAVESMQANNEVAEAAEEARKKAEEVGEEAKKKAEEAKKKAEELNTELVRAADDISKLEDEHRARVKIDEERSGLEKQKQALQKQMMELDEKIRANKRKRDAMDSQATDDPESNKRQKKQ